MPADQRGQILPFVALVMAAVGVVCLGLGKLGGAAVARAQARTAADAAALAGAVEGREAAVTAARWNGARLVSYQELGPDTRVQVELGGARASARARLVPDVSPGSGDSAGLGGGADPGGLTSPMVAALRRAEQLLGGPVPITSGYRSPAQQAVLYARRGSNPYPVAAPGRSRHQQGVAVDVPLSFVPRLLSVAQQVGLCQPYPRSDPVHFELCARGVP